MSMVSVRESSWKSEDPDRSTHQLGTVPDFVGHGKEVTSRGFIFRELMSYQPSLPIIISGDYVSTPGPSLRAQTT